MKQISEVLQDARLEKNLSIRSAAAAIGISAMYLSKIEAGKQIPSDEILGKSADFYGLSQADVIRVARYSSVKEGDRRQKIARSIYEVNDEELLRSIEELLKNAKIRRNNGSR